MSMSSYFKQLGAPLKNARWSWGALRKDGSLVLRVWQHERKQLDGSTYFRVTHFEKFSDNQDDLGYQERIDQIQLIEHGAKAFMVMCSVENPEAKPHKVKEFNEDEVFLGGKLLKVGGDFWLEMTDRIPARNLS